MPTSDAALITPRFGRTLFAVNAVVVWLALVVSFILMITGYYITRIKHPEWTTVIGTQVDGINTPLERLFDWTTYFTIWSNFTIAIVMTVLVFRPGLFTRQDRVGAIWRALRLDSILMISVTGIVFNLVLFSGTMSAVDALNNSLLHVVSPIVTVLVWLVAGPRRLISIRCVWLSLALPLIWLAYAFLRGAFIGAYPYPFLDVAKNGWSSVLIFVGAILVASIVLSFIFKGIDALISQRLPASQ